MNTDVFEIKDALQSQCPEAANGDVRKPWQQLRKWRMEPVEISPLDL